MTLTCRNCGTNVTILERYEKCPLCESKDIVIRD
jgi:rubrerythrin